MTDDEFIALGLYDESAEDAKAQLDLLRNLVALGASAEEIVAANKRGRRHLQALRSALLLYAGGPYDVDEIAEQGGVSVDDLVQWWRTVGLPDPRRAGSRLGSVEMALANNLAAGLAFVPRDIFMEFGVAFGTSMRQVAKAIMEMMSATVVRDLAKSGASESDINVTFGELANALIEAGTPAIIGLLRLHLVTSLYEALEVDGDERGVRTILFVDLVGYTSLTQRLDSGELSSVLSALEQHSVAVASATDGRVVKFLGDGVLLSFHQPSDAIEAARQLVGEHPALPARRAGMSTGPVLARQGDYFGPTVNLAARLAAVAGAGEILSDAAPDGVAATAVGEVELKGFDDPVTAYRVEL